MGELTGVARGAPGRALVVNAGSTSLKAAVFADNSSPEPRWATSVDIDGIADATDRRAWVEGVLRSAPELDRVTVVGHRVVHGGRLFDGPVVVDAAVERAIEELEELAPLHNRAALDGIAAARRVVAADVAHVAVFDTSFHHTLPDAAAAYGGPYRWLDEGLHRYGFHGINHQYAAGAAATILGRPLESLRLVTCHLGGGCSLAAVDRGRSVDTTMGFTPLDGLVMSTRSGAVDPGLILHLLRSATSLEELQSVLEERSGLLGLSGVSADLRQVIAARDAGDERAALAVDVFVHRVATGVGAMIGALGGVDAIVLTGGIGEHTPEVRVRVGERFAFLGVSVDADRNRSTVADGDLSADHISGDHIYGGDVSSDRATVPVLVVHAREELAIARDALRLAGR